MVSALLPVRCQFPRSGRGFQVSSKIKVDQLLVYHQLDQDRKSIIESLAGCTTIGRNFRVQDSLIILWGTQDSCWSTLLIETPWYDMSFVYRPNTHLSPNTVSCKETVWYAGIPVSPECKDLLSKVLVGNPKRRYTVQQIQKHPWFLKDLPPGVIQMNAECLKLQHHSSGSQTDSEIHSIVMQAIGTRTLNFEDDDDYIDDIMVSVFSSTFFKK